MSGRISAGTQLVRLSLTLSPPTLGNRHHPSFRRCKKTSDDFLTRMLTFPKLGGKFGKMIPKSLPSPAVNGPCILTATCQPGPWEGCWTTLGLPALVCGVPAFRTAVMVKWCLVHNRHSGGGSYNHCHPYSEEEGTNEGRMNSWNWIELEIIYSNLLPT